MLLLAGGERKTHQEAGYVEETIHFKGWNADTVFFFFFLINKRVHYINAKSAQKYMDRIQ